MPRPPQPQGPEPSQAANAVFILEARVLQLATTTRVPETELSLLLESTGTHVLTPAGLHDIAAVLLVHVGEELAGPLLLRAMNHHLREFLRERVDGLNLHALSSPHTHPGVLCQTRTQLQV